MIFVIIRKIIEEVVNFEKYKEKNLRFEINLPRKQKCEIGETVMMTLIILQ